MTTYRLQTFFDSGLGDNISSMESLETACRMFRNQQTASMGLDVPAYIEIIIPDSGSILACWSPKLGLWVSDACLPYFHEAEIDGVLDMIATPWRC